ncbi:MAG: bifunctional UDP-N-acetylmuramoyl-tripeptide:D-alanyl-D-alanine ligase/alanine racemase [Cyclobacteriaceae bacterium]
MGDDTGNSLTTSSLPEITAGQWLSFVRDYSLETLITDTRHLPESSGAVFIAIDGANHDGHDYIQQAYTAGIRAFIVERKITYQKWPEANFWLTSSSTATLQDLAAFKRDQFATDVVGITGSNGKTIVKEWLSSILQGKRRVVKSPKSYNSQIGVPLSVWPMNDSHELGIFEAGISRPGEMIALERVIKPTIGVLTNIGSAHDAGFTSREEKIQEKIKLFKDSKAIVYCADNPSVDQEIKRIYSDRELVAWSSTLGSSDIHLDYKDNIISLEGALGQYSFTSPFSDKSSLENLSHIIVLLRYLGFNFSFIQQEISGLKQVKMRLELKEGLHHTYLIDDSYNNDLSGLQVALGFLAQQKQYQKKTLILAPIEQASESDADLYHQVAKLLSEFGINRLIGIGNLIADHLGDIPIEKEFYPDLEAYFRKKPEFAQEVVLVKGARNYQLEKIVADLQQKRHDTLLEINLEALVHNLNIYRERIKPETKLMVMVKAMAYGSGIREIAQILQHQKVDYLGVAYTDEGVELRKNGITLPIMVMNPSADSFELLEEYQLEPEIYDLKQLEEYLQHFKQSESRPPIHLKLETGMHRLGMLSDQLEDLISLLSENAVRVAGILTHLAGAEEPQHDEYSHAQVEQFLDGYQKLASGIKKNPLRHVVNSPGLLRFPQYHFDMVRLGIGIYGFDSSDEIQELLRVAGTLKTYISRIETIEKDESIGYGRAWTASRITRVATIPIGYADGYRRLYSNGRGKVSVNGELAPVIGNVCMDMCMIDVSEVECGVGDEVIIFGQNPTIKDLAEWADTIPYEILTSVSSRVRRTYVSE